MMKKLLFTSALAFIAAISFSFAQTKNITIPKGHSIEYVIGSKMEIDFKHSPSFEKDLKALLKSCFTEKEWIELKKTATYIELCNSSDIDIDNYGKEGFLYSHLKKNAPKGNIYFKVATMGTGMINYSDNTVINTTTNIAYLENGKTKKLAL